VIPRAAVLLRAAAAALLTAALLGLAKRHPFAPPFYALVVDTSPSMERRHPGFAAEARRLWTAFRGGEHPVVEAGTRRGEPQGTTDVAAGLRAAAALAPEGVETRILLATDELRDEGETDMLGEVLRRRGAKVFALEAPAAKPEARVVSISAPDQVYLGMEFPLRVGVAASQPGPVRVALSRWGDPVAENTVDVDITGYAELDFLQQLDRVGAVRYAAATAATGKRGASAEAGTAPSLEVVVNVERAPSVLWLAGDPGSAVPLIDHLRGLGVPVSLAHPADLALPAVELEKPDVIVLDNVPAAALPGSLLDALRAAVSGRGAGLLVVGGRTGLGSGEYADSPLEGDLPVRSGFRSPPPPPAASMVLAFDTSFSMAFRGLGEGAVHGTEPRKIDVARESAKGVVRVLRPGDRLGILGNSTDLFWITPLGEITDPGPVLSSLDAVVPRGDGIYFYSVLHEAREALSRETGGIRHLLVLCDTEDIDQYEIEGRGHSFDLVREMAREGMSLSVVGIGRSADKDVPFLRTATLLGHGDFYLVRDIAALPRYLVSDYRRIASARNYAEEEVQVLPAMSAARTFGVAATFPPLAGIALVTPREGAEVLLQADVGAPVFVTGALGRGRTAVFTGDSGLRWSEQWATGAGARDLWLRMIFAVSPGERRGGRIVSSLRVERGTGLLLLETEGRDAGLPPWPTLWASVETSSSPAPAPLPLERVGLRSYRSRSPLPGSGWRTIRIAEDRTGAPVLFSSGVREPLPEEEWPGAPRGDLVRRLAQLTGGRVVAAPDELVPARGHGRGAEWWTILLVSCAILCLLGESLVRARREG
jgi:hypothetical protein